MPEVTTASALDLSMMPALGVAARRLHQSLDEVEPELLHQLAGESPGVRPDREAESSDDIVARVLEGKRQQYRDARTFARTLAGDPRVADAEVRQAAQGVSQVLDRAVIAQRSGPDYSEQTGLSWNLSADPTISAGSAYQELKFAQDTGWTGSF